MRRSGAGHARRVGAPVHQRVGAFYYVRRCRNLIFYRAGAPVQRESRPGVRAMFLLLRVREDASLRRQRLLHADQWQPIRKRGRLSALQLQARAAAHVRRPHCDGGAGGCPLIICATMVDLRVSRSFIRRCRRASAARLPISSWCKRAYTTRTSMHIPWCHHRPPLHASTPPRAQSMLRSHI